MLDECSSVCVYRQAMMFDRLGILNAFLTYVFGHTHCKLSSISINECISINEA